MQIPRVLTDSGKECTGWLFGLRCRMAKGNHDSGRLEDTLRRDHCRSGEELKQVILRCSGLWNGQPPQPVPSGRAPVGAFKEGHRQRLGLFRQQPRAASGKN